MASRAVRLGPTFRNLPSRSSVRTFATELAEAKTEKVGSLPPPKVEPVVQQVKVKESTLTSRVQSFLVGFATACGLGYYTVRTEIVGNTAEINHSIDRFNVNLFQVRQRQDDFDRRLKALEGEKK
eukprot:TRINITY_DN15522_c0_g1_i2.p1 TRINITY_DN15522_c0_g1~~TRINITY_DN15522_c0_g1_i2.p1  ORF type:complete len:125 (-),score=6.55 TRINITY_DN15522_c0_g1_i2:150-524(-)